MVKEFIRKNFQFIINLAKEMSMLVQDIRLEIVLTAIAIGAVACIVKIPIEYDTNTMGQHKEFIVNKRTLKIHIPTCPSVDKMSEKNKLKKTNLKKQTP